MALVSHMSLVFAAPFPFPSLPFPSLPCVRRLCRPCAWQSPASCVRRPQRCQTLPRLSWPSSARWLCAAPPPRTPACTFLHPTGPPWNGLPPAEECRGALQRGSGGGEGLWLLRLLLHVSASQDALVSGLSFFLSFFDLPLGEAKRKGHCAIVPS